MRPGLYPRAPRPFLFAVLAATCLAALFRLAVLDHESLWLDELFTARVVGHDTWGALIGELAHDVHPPGYFALLRLWSHIAGSGDRALRFPSALAGIATVPVVALLGRRLFGSAAGVAGAWLLAVAPFAIVMSREARGNSLLAFLAASASLRLAGMYGESRRREHILYGFLCAALVYTHLFGLFVLVSHALWLAFESTSRQLSWRRARPWALAMAAGVATLLPWMGTLMGQASHFASNAWYVTPSADSLGYLWIELAGGFTGPAVSILLGLGLLLARPPGDGRGVIFLAASILGILVVPQVVSYLIAPVLRDRNVLPLLPVLLLTAGAGFAGIRPPRAAGLVVATVAVLMTLVTVRTVFGEPRLEQWREAAELVKQQWRPGDAVIANHAGLWTHYLRPPIEVRGAPADMPDAQVLAWLRGQQKGLRRVWVLHGHSGVDRMPLADVLPRGHTRLEDRYFLGARVILTDLAALPIGLEQLKVASPEMRDEKGVHFWWNASVRSEPLSPPSSRACRIGLSGYSDPAGGVLGQLILRFMADDRVLGESRVNLPAKSATVLGAPLDVPPSVQLELLFVNDGEGRSPAGVREDRNAHVESLFLQCGD